MRKFHHGLRRFCALLVGVVFFVAGALKLMDPVGTSLIVGEYFKFLGMTGLLPVAKVLGVALALFETLLGAALVSGVARKLAAAFTLALLGIFTGLTLALLIANPEMDCGCFGEAVHLTHAQSFIKNLVLLGLSGIAFIPWNDGFVARNPKKWSFFAVSLAAILFMVYSLRNLPLQDFTDFGCGTQVVDSETVFSEDDTTPDGVVVLSFSDPFGEYCDYLAGEGDVMLLSVYEPEMLGEKYWSRASALVTDAMERGVRPIVLAPSAEAVPMELGEHLYFSDYKTLLTLNRSNGGATYLSDGLIVRKWAAASLPSGDDISGLLESEPLDASAAVVSGARIAFQTGVMVCLALLILL